MPTLLFVCTGNSCRSPMAAALLRDLLRAEGSPTDWTIASAGTWAREGQPASTSARWAMKARGLDLTEHRSRRVTEDMLRACDVALVMEDGHRQALRAEFPDLGDRVHLISELVGEQYSIGDPNGDPPEVYVALAEELAELLRRGMPRLKEMLG